MTDNAQNVKNTLHVAIVGPTATGKTDAAIAVCKAHGGEVISMDSMQIYKGMDIGTATPSDEEMQGIPHHMLSCIAPDRPYSAADYQRDARAVAEEIASRGKLPVFCGGTGLYLQAVSRPLTFSSAVDDGGKVRERLMQQAIAPDGPAVLFERLRAIDPVSAERICKENVRRVIRAIEIFELTGVPMSATASEWADESVGNWLIFALHFPRDVLYARINERVKIMVRQGLFAEVRRLLDEGVPPDAQAMQAIGYKEVIAHFHGEISEGEAIERIQQSTRRYAKRQITWLKRDERVTWVDVQNFSDKAQMHQFWVDQIRQAKRGQ